VSTDKNDICCFQRQGYISNSNNTYRLLMTHGTNFILEYFVKNTDPQKYKKKSYQQLEG
jgi:hypothetical protein